MIYTFTANPSLDYKLKVMDFNAGRTNRSKRERIVAGGKGLNVSIVLKKFGIESKTLGIVAGFTGRKWCQLVDEQSINSRIIELDEGDTRINVKLYGASETEINAEGPVIPENRMQDIYALFEEIKDGDTLVISGNAVPGVANDFYANIIDSVSDRDVRVIVDCSGEQMRNALPCHPYLIKPNIDELKDIGSTCIDGVEDIVSCSRRLIRMGAENVLVSAGAKGAYWIGSDGKVFKITAPKCRVKNSVGAGDSMVAAVLYALDKKLPFEDMLKLTVATGTASVTVDDFASYDEIKGFIGKVTVEEVNI